MLAKHKSHQTKNLSMCVGWLYFLLLLWKISTTRKQKSACN